MARYCGEGRALDTNLTSNIEDMYVHTSSGGKMKVELVGEEKTKKKQEPHKLLDISLKGMAVNCMGKGQQIRDLCPLVVQLDLQKTLLSDFLDVSMGCTQLSSLESLNLSRNRFVEMKGNQCTSSITVFI